MAELIWTAPALDDLDNIAGYIALSNLPAAKKLVNNVFDKTDRLVQHPESGKRPVELAQLNYREIVVNPCRIFYKIEADTVFVLHVLRQEQQMKRYIFDER